MRAVYADEVSRLRLRHVPVVAALSRGRGLRPSGLIRRQRALQDRRDVSQRVIEIEEPSSSLALELRRDVGVRAEEVAKAALAVPGLHRVALHEDVGLLARQARLDEREEHRLAEVELRRAVEVLLRSRGRRRARRRGPPRARA